MQKICCFFLIKKYQKCPPLQSPDRLTCLLQSGSFGYFFGLTPAAAAAADAAAGGDKPRRLPGKRLRGFVPALVLTGLVVVLTFTASLIRCVCVCVCGWVWTVDGCVCVRVWMGVDGCVCLCGWV